MAAATAVAAGAAAAVAAGVVVSSRIPVPCRQHGVRVQQRNQDACRTARAKAPIAMQASCQASSGRKQGSSGGRHPLFTTLAQPKTRSNPRLHAAEGDSSPSVPEELNDGKFAPIDEACKDRFGPEAVLLVGFKTYEEERLREMLREVEADFLKVIRYSPPQMQSGTLMEALLSPPNPTPAPPDLNHPRMIFLSGLSGGEVMDFIDLYKETGLPQSIFAAAVPKNADSLMTELMKEIIGDHEMLGGKVN